MTNNEFAAAVVIGSLIAYFLPFLVAGLRDHRNTGAILALNLLAGWTFVGWLVAFVWACTSTRPKEIEIHATGRGRAY